MRLVPFLVGRAVTGGDAERFIAPLALRGRLLLAEPVEPLPALHEPVQVGELALLLLRRGRGERQVALALLDVDLLGVRADGGSREPDLVLRGTGIEVVVLQEGVTITPVGMPPALAVAALGRGLSQMPDLLTALDKPL